MSYKVIVCDNISDLGVRILREAGFEVDVRTGLKPDELKAAIPPYHGAIVRSATKFTADIIAEAKNLKVIGRAGSGLDNVDKAAATKKGIVVMNTPGGNTVTTAEHTVAMMFALARKVPQATASMKAGQWEKKKFMGVELFRKTLGIVGLGQIGKQVARIAQGIEMNVLAYDPFLSDELAQEMGVVRASVDEIFRKSDFITFHTPLTAETKYMVNAEAIKTMKQGVRLINCARGGIINEADLLDALNSGHVAGAALDVFEVEPPAADNQLVKHENVVSTPHLGASTDEAQVNVAVAISEQIADYLKFGTIRHAVNFPSIPLDQVPKLTPYIQLAEGLGSFASQVFGPEISEIELEFRGEAAELNTAPVAMAALKGILTPIFEETVNFVNAPLVAKERGIEVKESKSTESGDYHSMLIVTLKSRKQSKSFAGTLFSRRDPRIVQVDGFSVEILPQGNVLVVMNNDRPGVIGGIGTLMARDKINIAWMHFGRKEAGGLAISVVAVDSALSDAQLEELRKLPNILSATQVYL